MRAVNQLGQMVRTESTKRRRAGSKEANFPTEQEYGMQEKLLVHKAKPALEYILIKKVRYMVTR